MRRAASMTGSAFRGNEVKRACDPVPGVDGRYGDSKRLDFGVGKLRSDSVSHLSRCAMRRCFGQSLGPFQSKTFARIKQRSEEHTSELQSLMRISYAVFCLKKKKKQNIILTLIYN